MIQLNVPKVPRQDPWNWSFAEKSSKLKRNGLRVAYFYRKPDNSTFRYRVYNMIQAINSLQGSISATYFDDDDIARGFDFLERIDILVVCRALYTRSVDELIVTAKAKGLKVLFDIDDLVFDTRHTQLVLNTLDQEVNEDAIQFWFGRISRYGATLSLCDGAITTNHFLAGLIGGYTGKPVAVVPNFLNKEQMAISEILFRQKESRSCISDGLIHLGYFSGTPTHNRDFGMLAGALKQVLSQDDRIRLRIAGFMELNEAFDELKKRIEFVPFQDFINLQHVIAQTEINLVPLQDNLFTNCKSELKFFEAGIVGTVTIATPTFAFKQAIQHGVNGYLANSFEWGKQILELTDSFHEAHKVATKARDDAEAAYAWYRQGEAILSALGIDGGDVNVDDASLLQAVERGKRETNEQLEEWSKRGFSPPHESCAA